MQIRIRSAASPSIEPIDPSPLFGIVLSDFALTGTAQLPEGAALSGAVCSSFRLTGDPERGGQVRSNFGLTGMPSFQGRFVSNFGLSGTAADYDYGYDRDFVVAGQPVAGEAFTDFVIEGLLLSDPTFRTVANGGRVASATADDVRFQLHDAAGTKLDHTVVSYAPTTGDLRVDLRLPSGDVAADFRFKMRYGNAGVLAPEANPAGCWRRPAAAWSWADGSDLTGQGRSLTLNAVAATTLQGPAGLFSAVSADTEYPAVGAHTTHTCATQGEFTTALGVAAAGDHIVVANGLSVTGFTMSRAGSAGLPIVIRAAVNQGAAITSDVTVTGDYVTFWGFDLGAIGVDLTSASSFVKFRRCRWHGRDSDGIVDGPISLNVRGPDHSLEYCQFDTMRFCRGIWTRSDAYRLKVDHCLFKDFTGTSSTRDQTFEPLTTGQGAGTHLLQLNVTLSNSVFMNINLNNAENEAVSVKSTGTVITNCLFDDAKNMNLRYGNNGRFVSCTIKGNGEVNIHGKGHLFNSVSIASGSKSFNFTKGDADGSLSTEPAGSSHPSAYDVTLIGCSGGVHIGEPPDTDPMSGPWPFRATGIKLYGHTGTVTNTQGAPTTDWQELAIGLAPEAAAAPCSITEADVGVAASASGASFGRYAGSTWASLSAFAFECWIQYTAAGYVVRIGLVADTTDVKAALRIGSAGELILVRRVGANTRTSTTSPAALGSAMAHVFAVFPANADPMLYVNGSAVALTHTGTAPTGALAVTASDEIAIGDPSGSLTGFAGKLGRFVLWPFAPSAAWVGAAYRTQGDSVSIIGMSAENAAGDSNRGPVAIPMTGTATTGVEVTFDVAGRAYDPESATLTASVPTAPTLGTSRIVSGRVGYTPVGGSGGQTHTVPFRVTDALRASNSIIRVAVSAAVGPYAWTLPFPRADAVTSANVYQWPVGDAMPTHNVGDIGVVIGNGAPISALNVGNYQVKGPLVITGFTFQPQEAGIYASYDSTVRGRAALSTVKFASDAKAHALWEGRDWPFLWFTNNYIDPALNDCCFFDVMKVYQAGYQSNDPVTHAFRGPKAAVFWQRNYFQNGPSYVSVTAGSADNRDGHSDLVQLMGGVPIIRVADCHLKMTSGQGFYQGKEAELCGFPRSTRWEFYNTAFTHEVKWNSRVVIPTTGTGLQRIPKWIMGDEGAAGVEQFDYNLGQYVASYFGSQCYVQGLFTAAAAAEKKAYLQPTSDVGLDASNNYTFGTVAKGDHSYPIYTGSLKYLAPTDTLPTVCDPAQTGFAVQFNNKAAFIAAVQP